MKAKDMDLTHKKDLFSIVINHEEMYSIWPKERALPKGWKDAGFSGTKTDCLRKIEEVWTDMRPLSLRKG